MAMGCYYNSCNIFIEEGLEKKEEMKVQSKGLNSFNYIVIFFIPRIIITAVINKSPICVKGADI